MPHHRFSHLIEDFIEDKLSGDVLEAFQDAIAYDEGFAEEVHTRIRYQDTFKKLSFLRDQLDKEESEFGKLMLAFMSSLVLITGFGGGTAGEEAKRHSDFEGIGRPGAGE